MALSYSKYSTKAISEKEGKNIQYYKERTFRFTFDTLQLPLIGHYSTINKLSIVFMSKEKVIKSYVVKVRKPIS